VDDKDLAKELGKELADWNDRCIAAYKRFSDYLLSKQTKPLPKGKIIKERIIYPDARRQNPS